MLKSENVQNVHRAYIGMHARTVERLTAHIAAACSPKKYMQHEQEQLKFVFVVTGSL